MPRLFPSRPAPYLHPDTPPGSAPDLAEDKAEVKEDISDARDDLKDAKATGDPKDIAAAEARLQAAEDRLAKLEVDFTSLRQHSEGRAAADHAHEMPSELKALHEHLREVEEEETPPARKRHWLYRPIRSRSA